MNNNTNMGNKIRSTNIEIRDKFELQNFKITKPNNYHMDLRYIIFDLRS